MNKNFKSYIEELGTTGRPSCICEVLLSYLLAILV